MEEFKIVFTRVAEKDIAKLKPEIRLKILRSIKGIESSPFPKGNAIRKIKGTRIPLYRLRVGDFRVIYHIGRSRIVILLVVDRKHLEKKLRSFL